MRRQFFFFFLTFFWIKKKNVRIAFWSSQKFCTHIRIRSNLGKAINRSRKIKLGEKTQMGKKNWAPKKTFMNLFLRCAPNQILVLVLVRLTSWLVGYKRRNAATVCHGDFVMYWTVVEFVSRRSPYTTIKTNIKPLPHPLFCFVLLLLLFIKFISPLIRNNVSWNQVQMNNGTH